MAIRIRDEFAERETAEERFAELWALREFVHAQVRRIVRDPHEAEDLTQDTYIRVLAVLEALDDRPAAPYLATVARNLARNEVRRRRRLEAVPDVPEPSGGQSSDPAHMVEAAEACRRVLVALSQLPAGERARVLSSALDGLTPTEIATAEGSTSGAVRSSLMRARARLRLVGEWAGAPVTSLAAWLRRRDPDTGLRLQHSAAGPGQILTERVAQVVAVAGAAVTLSVMPLPHASVADAAQPPAESPVRELVASAPASVAEVAGPRPVSLASNAPAATGDLGPLHGAEPLGADDSPDGSGTGGAAPPDAWADPITPVPSPTVDPADPAVPDEAPQPVKRQPASIPRELARISDLASSSAGSQSILAIGQTGQDCAGSCPVLFLSPDGGASWVRLAGSGLSETATSVALAPEFPRDPRIVSAGAVLQISRDAGATFETVPGPKGPIALSPDFSAGDPRVLVGGAPTWAFNADSGASQPGALSPLFGTEQRLAFFDSETVMAGTMIPQPIGPHRPAVARCIDGRCDEPVRLPHGIGLPDVAVIGSQVWAWTGSGSFVSADGGATFSAVALPLKGIVTDMSGVGGRIHVAMSNIQDWTQEGAVLTSLDGGATWAVSADEAFAHGVKLIVTIADGQLIAAPSTVVGGVRCSKDHGRTWAETCAG